MLENPEKLIKTHKKCNASYWNKVLIVTNVNLELAEAVVVWISGKHILTFIDSQ